MQTPEDQKEETSHCHTVGFARVNGKRKQNCFGTDLESSQTTSISSV